MKSILLWNEAYLEPVAALLCFVLGYTVYFFFSRSNLQNRLAVRLGFSDETVGVVVLQRLVGFLFLGIFPAIILLTVLPGGAADYGFRVSGSVYSPAWIAAVAVVVLPLTALVSRRPAFMETYPQIRKTDWGPGMLLLNAGSWAVYLLAYEFCFRGFLLFACSRSLGVWPAIFINLALYACVHMPKGLAETIGTLPLGFVFCVAAFHTGTIWVPFFGHLILALANDTFALMASREMRLRWKGGGRR